MPLRYFAFRYFATSIFCVQYLATSIFCVRYFATSIFCFRYYDTSIFCVRYFALDISHSIFCPPIFCVFDILPFDIWRCDILRFRYFAYSIFCDSICCDFDILRFLYFAIRYFAFRYFVRNPFKHPLPPSGAKVNIHSGFLTFPKSCFLNFRGQKLKIFKIRDSHLLELFKYHLLFSFLAIRFTNVFLTNFRTFIFFRTKIAGGDVTKSALPKKIVSPNLIFLHQTT